MAYLFRTFQVGAFGCNCTVLADETTREAVVIDPGDATPEFLDYIRNHDLKVRRALHTHAHLDHVTGTRVLKEGTGCEIHLHQGDEWLYQNLRMQGQMFGFDTGDPLPIDHHLEHGEEIRVGPFHFKVIHTPGHSPGSCTFHLPDQQLAFTGDTLFAQSIGRTDLWGGSHDEILASLTDRLLSLDDRTRIVPGHGPTSTIGVERAMNPFLRGV